MKRIVVETIGGPEQMKLVDAPKPVPGPNEAVVAVAFSGVNFLDVYFRTGLYKADPPIVLGSEASGTVESVGRDVTEVAPATAWPTPWCAARTPSTRRFPRRNSSRFPPTLISRQPRR